MTNSITAGDTRRAMAATPQRGGTPTLSVVVVNWNTGHLIDDCLGSVFAAAPDAEVVVVDNASDDDSLDRLSAHHGVTVLSNDDNVGYQAACNQGTRSTSGTNVLHINTDARLFPGTLDRLLEVLAERPEVGIVAPRLLYGDGSFQRWTAGSLPTLRSLAVSFLVADRFGTGGHGIWIDRDRRESGPVGWVSSACLLVRREVFDRVGGLDERLFAYMDDVDLCAAAAADGWSVWYEPSVAAEHFMGGSQQHPGHAASPRAIIALVTWFRLERGQHVARAAAAIMVAGFILRAVGHAAASLVGRGSLTAARHHLGHAGTAIAAGRQP